MVAFSKQGAENLRVSLLQATVKCSERCLYQSAKWAAELSASLGSALEDDSDSLTDVDSPMDGSADENFFSSVVIPDGDPQEASLEAKEFHKYLLAKSYFDCREFERCTAVFLPSVPRTTMAPPGMNFHAKGSSKGKGKQPSTSKSGFSGDQLAAMSRKSLFLALYAKYLTGEKKRDEASEMILGQADRGTTLNGELGEVSKLLAKYFDPVRQEDPVERWSTEKNGGGWLEYLYGLVLAKGKNEDDARFWLLRSVYLYPWNWGAWSELNDLIGSVEQLQAIAQQLPKHLMSLMFMLYANQELYQSTEEVHRQLSDLNSIFPDSLFLKTQRALLYYHSKDFDEAEAIFSDLVKTDPYRIDSLDHYSNILYVMSERPKLAFLASLVTTTDKFRPETCCVVGNYYSLKSEHEKAVQYFRRALTLDRNFLSAWTLMGHEYVEMKNTHAAIESYRRAVDVNRKDYRAWYGLGQTYEVLEMHLYALYYYRRAALLRPYDSKMWHAVGSCFDKIGKPLESIKAYKRALAANTLYDTSSSFGSGAGTNSGITAPDGWMMAETLHNIALMYEKLQNMEEAAAYMEMVLAQEEGTGGEDDDVEEGEGGRSQGIGVTLTTSKARMWLAKWEFSRGNVDRATELAQELCQDGVEVEEAKALIRDLRARTETPADLDD